MSKRMYNQTEEKGKDIVDQITKKSFKKIFLKGITRDKKGKLSYMKVVLIHIIFKWGVKNIH